jgi:hypothetical protein
MYGGGCQENRTLGAAERSEWVDYMRAKSNFHSTINSTTVCRSDRVVELIKNRSQKENDRASVHRTA